MKKLARLLLPIVLLFPACAHRARVYKAPDHSKLTEASTRLHAAVTKATPAAAAVRVDLERAQSAHVESVATVARIETQLADLARVAPPELMPRINGMQEELAKVKRRQDAETTVMKDAFGKLTVLESILVDATKAKVDVERYGPEYDAAVEAQTVKLNTAEAAWAKDSKEIVDLRMGSIFTKILAFIGGLIILVIAGLAGFLWWSGRLATTTAAVASAIRPP